jgi:predicted alpha/beta hydrolase
MIPDLGCLSRFTVPAEVFAVERPRASLIILPAMGTPARVYRPMAEAMAARAFNVLLPDLPGTGDSRPRPSRKADYAYMDLVGPWLGGLIEAARGDEAGAPLLLFGHSLGAQVGALALARGQAIDALITVAGGHIHYRNWKGLSAAKVLFAAVLFRSISKLAGYLPGQYFGFGGPQARSLIRDWSGIISGGHFSHITDRLDWSGPAASLCIGYEGDSLAPAKSVESLAAMLGADLERLPASGPGNPHASWTRSPEPTIRTIIHWLEQKGIIRELP